MTTLSMGRGILCLCALPGATGDMGADLRALEAHAPRLALSLVEPEELRALGCAALFDAFRARGIELHHLPIRDYGIPPASPDWSARLGHAIHRAHEVLQHQCSVLIHCRGGCGRTGMIALRLMIALGDPPDAALARLRSARPCAIETDPQLAWATG